MSLTEVDGFHYKISSYNQNKGTLDKPKANPNFGFRFLIFLTSFVRGLGIQSDVTSKQFEQFRPFLEHQRIIEIISYGGFRRLQNITL